MSSHLVDVGRRVPLVVDANDAADAAFKAWLMLDGGFPSRCTSLTVKDMEGDKVVNLVIAERKCRKCGCTEDKACPGGCCWMAWDLCSRCVE